MTPFDTTLITAHETKRFRTALRLLREHQEQHDIAEERYQRWMLPGFSSEVLVARKAFAWWSLTLTVIVGSFLLNCLLVQELVPDFAALVERLAGFDEVAARLTATIGLTGVLFAVMLTIKWWGHTGDDLAALRMASHSAVQRPVKSRIARKTAVKIAYLIALAAGYIALYLYISGGAQLDAILQDTAERMADTARARLGETADSVTITHALDADIASSQAASFAVYYAIEWALHALILFTGAPLWFEPGFATALASATRDRDRVFRTRTEQDAASARLSAILTSVTPDDGANAIRRELAAQLPPAEKGLNVVPEQCELPSDQLNGSRLRVAVKS